jgi:hypothetical protein
MCAIIVHTQAHACKPLLGHPVVSVVHLHFCWCRWANVANSIGTRNLNRRGAAAAAAAAGGGDAQVPFTPYMTSTTRHFACIKHPSSTPELTTPQVSLTTCGTSKYPSHLPHYVPRMSTSLVTQVPLMYLSLKYPRGTLHSTCA